MKRTSVPALGAVSPRRSGRAYPAWARIGAAVLALAAAALAGPYDTWGKYKTLTINTTNTGGGANVSGTVSSFPVLIRLTTANAEDILGEALANGADVRFTGSDGSTALSYQIERWSATAADIWVLVPSVTGNSTTDMRVYWKKSGQSDASSASSVFATSNSFAGVWHLAESGSNTVGDYKDATGTTNNTAAGGMTAAGAGQVTGVAGYGTAFDGSTSYLGFGTVPGSASSQTVSFWMKADVAAHMSVIDKLPNDASGVGWNFKARSDGALWYRVGSETSTSDWQKAGVYSAGTWVHIAGTFSGGTQNLYINGTAAGSALTSVTKSVNNSTTFLRFGIPSAAVTTEKFDGSLDEVQISSTARNSDWVKLTYQTQVSGATAILYGSTQATTYYWNRNEVLTSGTGFNKAYNWTMNADGTGRYAPSSTDDDFTSTSIGGSWTCQDSDNNTGTGTCDQTTKYGRLYLSGRGSDVYGATNEFTALRRSDITGDFDVTVRVDSVYNTHTAAKAGLFMADDFTTLGSGGFAGIVLRGDSKIEFLSDTTGTVGQIDYSSVSGSAVTPPVWVRLVKNGSLVRGYYRTSLSSAWTQQGNTTTVQSTAANSQIGLLLTSHNSSLTSVGVFDEFQGGTTISSTTLDLSFAGTGTNADATSGMTANLTAASINFTGFTGTFDLNNYTLTLGTGNATFASGMTLDLDTASTFAFTGTSGTQVLTPLSGASLPNISKSGAGTLQLSTYDLNCVSYAQSAGTLDFNGENVSTSENFTLTSGTSASFANLTGRTLTVGGNASFTGQSGNLVNLNQGAWTLTVSGTLTASYANIAFSDASGGTKGVASNSYKGRQNSNWLFSVPATLSNLTRSVRLNFNTTSSGANVSGNVTNFPLFLRFTSSNLTFSATSDSGSDLIFVDGDGTALYHQVIEWDKANQAGKVWVRVPQVDGNSSTDYITLYYGCDSCTSNSYARSDSVFSGFKSVFHLNAPEAKAYDATTLANHGAYVSNLPNLADGGIVSRNAAVFDGSASSYIDIPNESNYDLTTNLSVWAWIKVNSFSTAYQAIVTKADNTYRLSRDNSTNALYFACNKSSSGYSIHGSANVNDGNWHLIVGTYDGSNVKLYVDGAQDGSSTALTGSLDANNNDIYIGENAGQTGRNFNGSISEVRIGNTAGVLSSDYIKLSYETQKASSAFLTAFTTASFQSSKVFKLNTTASGANIASDVTNFPLLLRITGSTIVDGVQGSGTDAPADIRFLDGDGVTWLDYQVERWDRTLDSAEVWVRVPTIEGNYAGHTLTMYYKQASGVTLVDGQCASCVFKTSNSFVGAWHLNTSGTGTRPDATGNGYNLTANNYSGSELKGGVIAGADSLNGSNQYLSIGTNLSDFSGGFTYTGWAWWSSTGSYARLFDFGNGAPADNFWSGRSGTTTTWVSEIYNNTTSGTMKTIASQIATGAWAHFAVTISGTSLKMYKNGSLVLDATSGQSLRVATRNNNYLGRSNWVADSYFQGKFDEVAIASTVRDSNWIKLCYQNQRRDAAPLFNPSPADFRSTRKLAFNTTKTGANISADVSNYPLLVRLTASNGGFIDSVQNNAPDIRFLDGDGTTWLNYAIERWDKTTDSAEVWVMVPKVDGNSDHDFITLYYAQASGVTVADGQCASCVFGNYKAVYHLSESPGNSAPQFTDASGNSNSGTAQAGASGDQVSADIGKGFNLNGSTKYVSTTTSFSNPGTFTLGCWFKTANAYGSGGKLIGFGSSQTGSSADYDRHLYMGNDGKLNFGVNPTPMTTLTSASAYNDGNYHYAVGRLSSAGLFLWVDGAQVGSNTGVTSAQNFTGYWRAGYDNLGFWTNDPTSDYLNGTLDEVRIAHSEIDTNVIKLDYQTQRRSGNVFWNSRQGPNNLVVLTATATSSGNISLSWPSTVTDSSNADSLGIWVKYSGYPDSVGATGATFVAKLPKTDTAYSYPATYPTTYYFALAVRNTSGQWSPFTTSSSDSATLSGVTRPDTIYVDSAIGNNGNSCSAAQNPSTPKLTITGALTCGASASDTLVVRVMPGTYASDNSFTITTMPSVVTSFDRNSRAILAGNGSVTENSVGYIYAVALNTWITLRDMDVRANSSSNAHVGIYVRYNADSVVMTGNRIYGYSSYAFDTAIVAAGNNEEGVLIANNLIHRPGKFGVLLTTDDQTNVLHNVFYGTGGASTRGVYVPITAWDNGWFNIANNIFYNWGYGISTSDANSEIGNVSNNLFHMVTSGQEVTGESDAGKVLKDPLFANTTVGDPNAFKLLPGSPAIDAGTSTFLNTSYAWPRIAYADAFGSSRTLGTAPDIGFYEGTGYTPNPSGEFDTLAVSSTATTVTVQNSKWKLIWNTARGAGITEFYDLTTAPSTNLVATNSLLFDAKIDSYQASSQTAAGPALYLLEGHRARAVVRQRLGVSASLELNIYYSVYPSGHIYVESELSNLASGSTAVGTVDYTLKLGTVATAYASAGTKNGFGYLLTSTRDAMMAATRDLDLGASGSETWATSTAASGSPGTLVFNTADLANLSQNTTRRHSFVIYLGDNALDFAKTAAINADAYGPSALSASAGSLWSERSWQDGPRGHWTLDDGSGSSARDKSVLIQNNAAIAGSGYQWVSGKVGGGLYLTTADSAAVTSATVLDAANGFTLAFWIKPDFTMGDTAAILSKGLTTASGWYCRKAAGANQIKFTMGSATVTSPTLTDGAWTHIAVVADNGGNRNLELYVNGTQCAASTAAATATANSTNLVFGNSSGAAAGKFKGTLDDVRVYARELPVYEIQSICNRGFAARYGHYALRADNNNRAIVLINDDTAKTRVQPAFYLSNWYGPRTPKYVFLNGTRLVANTDFVTDTVGTASFGRFLILQLNKVLTGSDQTLFIDDDDSTGFMGTAGAMKSLTITATASDKIAVKNFADTVFGSAASGQWYMELDLNGWTTPTRTTLTDTGFGEINVWKAAAVSPNVAISSAYQMVGWGYKTGRALSYMKLDATGSNEIFTGGVGYANTPALTYTLTDSSSTRLSLTLSAITLSQGGTVATLSKRFTFYPTGRVFVSYAVTGATIDMDAPRLDLNPRYDGANQTLAWANSTSATNARLAWINGDLNFHSIGMALLSVKNNAATYTTGATMVGSVSSSSQFGASNDQNMAQFNMPTSIWTSANKPVTVNFMLDFSKDFNDSATADSLLKDSQNPAVLAAITGTRVTDDALDLNADNFAEGDGAYTYAASSGIAHFRFTNTVASFNPAFRVSTWTQGTLPEFVMLDNQVLTRGYHYNAYLNNAADVLVMQFNKTLAPGTHTFYISHKSGLAVKLNRFEAKGGDGVDTLAWTTESEFENLGFHLWRREIPADSAAAKDAARVLDSVLAAQGAAAPSGNASGAAGGEAQNGPPGAPDTLPALILAPEDLRRLGFVRITAKLIPGAPGGSSASTREYAYIDRTAAYAASYQYLLEAIDFNDGRVLYGPRTAGPGNPYETEIQPNYPNPFNPSTTLRFSLREKLKVSLVVYDARGRVVRTLMRPDKPLAPGKYRLIWDARNDSGVEVPSGQYFYRFTAGRYVKSRKMILLK